MEFINPTCLDIENAAVTWDVTAGNSSPTYNDSCVSQGAILYYLFMVVIQVYSIQRRMNTDLCIGLDLGTITAIQSDEICYTGGGGWDLSENCNSLVEPYPAWSSKQDSSAFSSRGSAEPGLPRTASKGSTRMKGTDEYFNLLPFTQEYSPAPSQLRDPKFDCPIQEFLSDSGECPGTNRQGRETEYNKEFVEECLMPFSPIQDQLIMLFFTHVHPMFPIMDEYSFVEICHPHQSSNELIAPKHFLLLLAISFVAFAVCSKIYCKI